MGRTGNRTTSNPCRSCWRSSPMSPETSHGSRRRVGTNCTCCSTPCNRRHHSYRLHYCTLSHNLHRLASLRSSQAHTVRRLVAVRSAHLSNRVRTCTSRRPFCLLCTFRSHRNPSYTHFRNVFLKTRLCTCTSHLLCSLCIARGRRSPYRHKDQFRSAFLSNLRYTRRSLRRRSHSTCHDAHTGHRHTGHDWCMGCD
jgi:hypothetical protein